jgi:Peptidase family M23/RTX calcium-binding nonapeptide repeat (4 copies)
VPAPRVAIAAMMLATAVAVLSIPGRANAAAGDVYKKGTEWCASTYPGHGTLGGFGPPLDLNGKGGVNDEGWPVHAPEDGNVTTHSEGFGSGWGNSIIWKSADGTEKLHLAHLQKFEQTGKVSAGEMIGRVGHTGESSGPHLHVSAQRNGEPAQVELMGKVIKAGQCYVSSGPIPPLCMGETATILGDGGDDVLVGTAEGDVIVALGGSDVIRARGGADVICAGGGKDEVYGKAGEDRIRGDDGADLLEGGAGADRLKGNAGPDALIGRGGLDRLFGQAGNDDLAGTGGSDRLSGGAGNDTAVFTTAPAGVVLHMAEGTASGEGSDVLVSVESAVGSGHPDTLVGDPGPNRLAGKAGDDVLKGKRGEDSLIGGGGADTCTGGETVVGCEA